MWPDMHSFYQIHTFEPLIFFWFSLRKTDHVLRLTDFTRRFANYTNSDRFWLETNQKLITWVILVRRFTEFTNPSRNRSEFVKLEKRRTIWNCGIGKTKHMISFSKRKQEKDLWFESLNLVKRMHIRSHGNRLFRIGFVKNGCRPRIVTSLRINRWRVGAPRHDITANLQSYLIKIFGFKTD